MSEESPCIQPTDITIRTNVDPRDETITTTTIVHLPFQVAQQCPPPKVISWMKSNRPRATQQSRPHASGQLQALIRKRRDSAEKMKKSDHTATVFSIQVTVLGRVVVPPISPHSTSKSSDLGPKQQLQQDHAMEVDLAPVKTIPARLNRAETTSYVIHRTFEDFQTLSESVLRLRHALDAASYYHHNQEPDMTTKTGTAPMANRPALTDLRLHHPHPGLYQTLMSRFGFSTAKANQRAFDASSTTHGFDEEGAFERVLELNQYLENVWYWLMPENTPPHLDLSVEKHDIMQWLKPSSMASHADGRQMKESQQKGSVTFSIPSAQHPARSKTIQSQRDSSIAASTPAPPVAPEEVVVEKEHDDHDHQQSEMTSSAASIPSLSSSPTSAVSSILISPAGSCIDQDSEGDEDQERGFAVGGSLHKSSNSASSTLIPSPVNNMSMGATMAATPDSIRDETPAQEEPMPRVSQRQKGAGAAKVARRMSFNHVFRSLTMNHHRRSRHESFHQRTTSASVPTSPRLKPLDEEIFVWSTETTKNSHFISSSTSP